MNFKRTLIAASVITSSAVAINVSTGSNDVEIVKYQVSSLLKSGEEDKGNIDKKIDKPNSIEHGLSSRQGEVLESIRTDIFYYMENYTIKKGDNISGIALSAGFRNYHDFVLLNKMLGIKFKNHKWKKNVIDIRAGEDIYIPKEGTIDEIKSRLGKLKK